MAICGCGKNAGNSAMCGKCYFEQYNKRFEATVKLIQERVKAKGAQL